jgi:hypothetical protein
MIWFTASNGINKANPRLYTETVYGNFEVNKKTCGNMRIDLLPEQVGWKKAMEQVMITKNYQQLAPQVQC